MTPGKCLHTVLAAEVRRCHVLQGDLPQKCGALAAWISCHDAAAPEPRPEPGQAAVTGEGIGQEVPDEGNNVRLTFRPLRISNACVSVCVSYSVDRLGSVSNAPGRMVLSWLSYSDRSRTLFRPVKLPLWRQLILLFLSILHSHARAHTRTPQLLLTCSFDRHYTTRPAGGDIATVCSCLSVRRTTGSNGSLYKSCFWISEQTSGSGQLCLGFFLLVVVK